MPNRDAGGLNINFAMPYFCRTPVEIIDRARARVGKKILPGIVVVGTVMEELGDVRQIALYRFRVITRTLGDR